MAEIAKQYSLKVLSIKDYSFEGKVTDKVVRFEKPEGFSFIPGQFVMIAHKDFKLFSDPSKLKWASMSIASAPQDEFIELCIAMKETPGLSNFLRENLKEGNYMELKGPFGVFTFKEDFEEVYFAATGTGIAPLLGMIKYMIYKGIQKPVKLFFGFRNSSYFLYKEELEGFKEKFRDFELIATISRPETDSSWKGRTGYVQEVLKDYEFKEEKKGIHFYLCGNPKAVPEIIKVLEEKGFPKTNIHREQW